MHFNSAKFPIFVLIFVAYETSCSYFAILFAFYYAYSGATYQSGRFRSNEEICFTVSRQA